jgi:hypothetical protein
MPIIFAQAIILLPLSFVSISQTSVVVFGTVL